MAIHVAPGTRADHQLAKRLAQRDPDAMREIYTLHGRTTFGFLLRLLGDRATAEDVQQQVFMEVWQRGDRYDHRRGSLVSWLLMLARSRAIDHLRRRVPEPHDPAAAVALADGAEDGRIDQLLEHWRLAEVIEQLPPEEADLLRRRFYLEQTQTDIAEATGLPLGTIKSRMARALTRMRDLLEEER